MQHYHQYYPGAVPDKTVLMYRHTGSDPYYCQVAGCGKSLGNKKLALEHGRRHCRLLSPNPEEWRVVTRTGPRPLVREEMQEYRRVYRRQWCRQKREKERQAQAAPWAQVS